MKLNLRVGMIFQNGGHFYMVEEIIPEENKRFRWDKVIAKWSCFGPRPLFTPLFEPAPPVVFTFNWRAKAGRWGKKDGRWLDG